MVYIIGVIGFISGFMLGQMLLLRLLKNVSNEELMENRSLRWKYGVLNWAIAILTSVSAVHLFKMWQDNQLPY